MAWPTKLRSSKFFNKERNYGQAWEDFKEANPLTGKRCECCGSIYKLQRHHIIGAHRQGPYTHTPANIEVLCKDCHILKHPHLQKAKRKL